MWRAIKKGASSATKAVSGATGRRSSASQSKPPVISQESGHHGEVTPATTSARVPADQQGESQPREPTEEQQISSDSEDDVPSRQASNPAWTYDAFRDLFADPCAGRDGKDVDSRDPLLSLGESFELLDSALQALATSGSVRSVTVSSESQQYAAKVRGEIATFSKLIETMVSLRSALPVVKDQRCTSFLKTLVHDITMMMPGQNILLPGGWSGGESPQGLVYIIHRREKSYSLSVVNTGPLGRDFHAVKCVQPAMEMHYNLDMRLDDIPESKAQDSAVWFLLLRGLLYPAPDHSAPDVYEHTITFFNGKPLSANVTDDAYFSHPARHGDLALGQCALLATRHLSTLHGASQVAADLLSLQIQVALCERAYTELKQAHAIRFWESRLLGLMSETIARVAANSAQLKGSLLSTDSLESILKLVEKVPARATALYRKSSVVAPPPYEIPSSGPVVDTDDARHGLYGRLANDFDTGTLVGDAAPLPIKRPVELTSVPESVSSIHEAELALQNAVDVVTLLANQADLVKNSYALRIAVISALFTRTLPVPQPPTAEDGDSTCIWASSIRRDTQIHIVHLLSSLCKHFTAATLSVQVTHSIDAVRIITMANMAAIADAVLRRPAADYPSSFVMHYGGTAPGPVTPFGFTLGQFAAESETMPLTDPELCSCRTGVLDYFRGLEELIADDHLIFEFETSGAIGEGELRLVDQICIHRGYPRLASKSSRYITGEERALVDDFPEFPAFRDIVFFFKLMMSPTSDMLPEQKRWSAADATLHWTAGEAYEVKGFGRTLNVKGFTGKAVHQVTKLVGRTLGKKLAKLAGTTTPRIPPSAADPSNLAGSEIKTEETVLHLPELPLFEDRLTSRDSEVLLQYLTAPYLRIPVVLNFFADEGRIHALSSSELQVTIDACLFEPGPWEPSAAAARPVTAPPKDRSDLSTRVGLLVNELVNAPEAVLKAVKQLLQLALDLDTGKFTKPSSDIILYATRIAVRVEDYVSQVLSGRLTSLYNIAIPEGHDRILREGLRGVQSRLRTDVFRVLERWRLKSVAAEQLEEACLVHTHQAYIFKSLTRDEVDARVALTLLSCQMFLNINFRWSLDMKRGQAKDRKSTGKKAWYKFGRGKKEVTAADTRNDDPELQLDQIEVIFLFQKHRRKILDFLLTESKTADMVMELVIQVLTFTGTLAIDEGVKVNPRHWQCPDLPGFGGRFVPDTEVSLWASVKALEKESYESWLQRVTTAQVTTELNVQLGEFALKKNQMKLVDDDIAALPEFRRALAISDSSSARIQCVEVEKTINREWIRIVGKRHDIYSWCADDRSLHVPSDYRKVSSFKGGEAWVKERVQAYKHTLFKGLSLRAPPVDHSTMAIAVLTSVCFDTDSRKQFMREVVVYRHSDAVHVFNVIEYGRRYYRSLIFSSSAVQTLHSMPPSVAKIGDQYVTVAGSLAPVPENDGSVVISRHLTSSSGEQTYLPSQLLYGVIPDGLLDAYTFWQLTDGTVYGYPVEGAPSASDPTILQVAFTITRSDSPSLGFQSAHAEVTRFGATLNSEGVLEIDNQKPVHGLVSLMNCRPNTKLSALVGSLSRAESLSYILVWAPVRDGQIATDRITIVELPRLGLSFSPRTSRHYLHDKDSSMRLFSDDIDGMYISNIQDDSITDLVQSLPHSLVLANASGSLAVLVPALARPGRPLKDLAFPAAWALDRDDETWCENVGDVPYYIYKVHDSRRMLIPPTLAASVYLLLMLFLDQQYGAVFRMADTIVSDMELTPEEAQLFAALGAAIDDCHPDAHACRVKISLVMEATGLGKELPWDPEQEFVSYIEALPFVSSQCRFSLTEEREIMSMCGPQTLSCWCMRNRQRIVEALSNGPASFDVQYPPATDPYSFDSVEDKSCLDWSSKFTIDARALPEYSRPTSTTGAFSIMSINSWLKDGMRLAGDPNSLGFLFFYEMLCNMVDVRILPGDSPHILASLLLRQLPVKDTRSKGVMMSVLRLIANNPRFCDLHPPSYLDLVAQRQASMSKSSIPGMSFVKGYFNKGDAAKEFLDSLQALIKGNQSRLEFPSSPSGPVFTPPATFAYQSGNVTTDRILGKLVPRVTNFEATEVSLNTSAPALGQLRQLGSNEVGALAGTPLSTLDLRSLVSSSASKARAEKQLPFDVSGHPKAKGSKVASKLLDRLQTDMAFFAERTKSDVDMFLQFLDPKGIRSLASGSSQDIEQATRALGNLRKSLQDLYAQDYSLINESFAEFLQAVNSSKPGDAGSESDKRSRLVFTLRQRSRAELVAWPELCIGLFISTQTIASLYQFNQFLTKTAARDAEQVVALMCLLSTRLGQVARCIDMVNGIEKLVTKSGVEPAALEQGLLLKTSALATGLNSKHHYVRFSESKGAFVFDPRFLVFEYSSSMMLRKQQVALINKLLGAYNHGDSICHQMIMGAGKTTVIAPLLSLILGTSQSLVSEVVPGPLLQFSRGVMRECFSAVIQKPVYTFQFDRTTIATPQLLNKLQKARASNAVVISTPTAVKSFYLKYLELIESIKSAKSGSVLPTVEVTKTASSMFGKFSAALGFGGDTPAPSRSENFGPPERSREELLAEAKVVTDIMAIFQQGTLLLDEVDMILHPLKSELNWPLGVKAPLDFTTHGHRYTVAYHLFRPVFLYKVAPEDYDADLLDSSVAISLLKEINKVIDDGVAKQYVQTTPHFVLLNVDFYHNSMKTLLARWFLLWLSDKGIAGLEEEDLLAYLLEHKVNSPDKIAALNKEQMKMLNLGHDWLASFVPHILSKYSRVNFGLLSPTDIAKAHHAGRNMPRSRQLLAVPFVGKDVPTAASEFSHPDVVIGFAIMAYQYEGLRLSDVIKVISTLRANMSHEFGAYAKRPSSKLFVEWVENAGGIVRGTASAKKPGRRTAASPDFSEEIWPLHMVDERDMSQVQVLFDLFHRNPHVIKWYLVEYVFPSTMEFQRKKLSASGQELGGDLLFARRIGFSGTPSDLLPLELGSCCYEQGDDARMINVLTDPGIVDVKAVPAGWNAHSLLDIVAQSSHHALIDTGALITGMSNLQVAQELLKRGLKNMLGVVYLDEYDRKMVLMRANNSIVPLSQCGLAWNQRFTFYDQVHTTGMDIKQHFNARAFVTLGKDMSFRDFAQGAYRMRGVGKGQQITLLVIPEITSLVSRQLSETAHSAAVTKFIVQVTAWLTLNGILSEKMQFAVLCQQNLQNLWRKEAYKSLLQHVDKAPPSHLGTFHDDVNLDVSSDLPKPGSLLKQMELQIRENSELLSTPQLITTANGIVELLRPSSDESLRKAQRQKSFDAEQQQEQEEEQEMEIEQEEEMEIEKEQERVPIEPVDKDYIRDEEPPRPWQLGDLGQSPDYSLQGFFPLSDFAIHSSHGMTPTLQFPGYLYASRNFYNKEWASKAHRRLNNVLTVLEFVPSQIGDMAEELAPPLNLSTEQVTQLKDAFHLFDADGNGLLGVSEVGRVLEAMDMLASPSEVEALFKVMDKDGNGTVEFQELYDAVCSHSFYRIESGRFYVVVTLAEAEAVRAFLHRDPPSQKRWASVRVHAGMTVLDSTPSFPEPSQYQDAMMRQCYRFFDSETDYSDLQLNMLLRSLQSSPCQNRERFFVEVRSCRRRVQRPWEETPLARLFSTDDEYSQLTYRATTSRVRILIRSHGLHLRDAFRLFDTNRDGTLSNAELYAGIHRLGLRTTPSQINSVIRAIDRNSDGLISFEEFQQAFKDPFDDDDDATPLPPRQSIGHARDTGGSLSKRKTSAARPNPAASVPTAAAVTPAAVPAVSAVAASTGGKEKPSAATAQPNRGLPPKPLRLPSGTLAHFKVHLEPVHRSSWVFVWNSRGTPTSKGSEASVWAPNMTDALSALPLMRKKESTFTPSHFLSETYDSPSKSHGFGRRYCITMVDEKAGKFKSSKYLSAISNQLFPPPARYEKVHTHSSSAGHSLTLWKPIPPSEWYVALGMIATRDTTPPPLEAIQCVARALVVPSRITPTLVYTSNARGEGKSFWIHNSLGCFIVTDEGQSPSEKGFDLLADEFRLSEMPLPEQATYFSS